MSFTLQGQELIPKEKDGLYGFFEKKNMVVDFQYDSVAYQYDGSYIVRKDSKWGLISSVGREAIPCNYDFLDKHIFNQYVASYNGKFGMLDSTGTILLDFLFDKIDHIEKDTLALVKYQDSWCLYKNGVCDYDETKFVFSQLDIPPLFPACTNNFDAFEDLKKCAEEKMYKYIFEHLTYPREARHKGIQGIVIVQYIITKDGVIQDPIIRRGLGGGCDEEVLRMVNAMPNWIPAVKDGKNVACRFTLPVKFVLQR